MARHIIAVGLLAATLAACGGVRSIGGDPVKTSLPQTLKSQPGTNPVAVCYVGGDPKAADIVSAVQEICKEPGSTVSFHSNDLVFNDCPLMKKRRAVYYCTAPAITPSGAAPARPRKGPPKAGPLQFPQY